MSRRPALQVEGARQLRATLKAAGVSVTDLRAAHAEVAGLVVRRAAPTAPTRTGRLAASIRGSGTQSAAVVRAGRARVPYAGPIHWGWAARHIESNPWIWNAAQDARPAWETTYLHAIEAIIATVEGTTAP